MVLLLPSVCLIVQSDFTSNHLISDSTSHYLIGLCFQDKIQILYPSIYFRVRYPGLSIFQQCDFTQLDPLSLCFLIYPSSLKVGVFHTDCLAHRRECWIKGKYIKIHNKKLFFLFEIPDTTSLPPKLYFYLCFLIIMIKCMIKKSTLSGIKPWPHPWAIMWPWKRYLTSVSQFLLWSL